MSLSASDLGYRHGRRWLLRGIDLQLEAGQIHAVLGPNGAGKSTLVRLLSGELSPDSGRVECAGRPLAEWTPAALARQRAVMPQQSQLNFGLRVEEVVQLGRLPWTDESHEKAETIIDAVLELTGTAALRERTYPTLSGGERARVQLARVLAQIWTPSPDGGQCLLLDEPTANLDLAYQHRCLQIARRTAARGIAVLVVLHDPNLVFSYADRVTVLRDGQRVIQGPPDEALDARLLSDLYRMPVAVSRLNGLRVAQVRSDISHGAG